MATVFLRHCIGLAFLKDCISLSVFKGFKFRYITFENMYVVSEQLNIHAKFDSFHSL